MAAFRFRACAAVSSARVISVTQAMTWMAGGLLRSAKGFHARVGTA
jgi:hypothetical protein